MATGRVRWFNAAKGFGYIEPDDQSEDVRFYRAVIEAAGLAVPDEGQRVEYEARLKPRWLEATSLRLAD